VADTRGVFNPQRNDGWRLVLEQDLSQFKWTTGPESIYGDVLPEVPAGYKVIAFRPPVKGEWFINVILSSKTPVEASGNYREPRLILQPI
jgi:hypothetical protein